MPGVQKPGSHGAKEGFRKLFQNRKRAVLSGAAAASSSDDPVEMFSETSSGEDYSEASEDELMADVGDVGLSARQRFVKHDELLRRVIPLLQSLGVEVRYTTYKEDSKMVTVPTRLVFKNGEEISLFEQGTTEWHGQRRKKETQWTGSQPSSLYFLAFNDVFPHQLMEELVGRLGGLMNPVGAWRAPKTLRQNQLVYDTIMKKVDKEPTRPLEVRHNACSLYNFAAGHKGEDSTILLFLEKYPHTAIADAHLMLSPYSLVPGDTRRQGVSPDGLMIAFYKFKDGRRVPIAVSVEIKYRAGCGSSGCKTRRKKLAQEMLRLKKRNAQARLKLAKADIVGDVQSLYDAEDGLIRWDNCIICNNPKHKPPHDHPCEYYAGQCQLHMFKQGTGVCLNAYGGLRDGRVPIQRGFVMLFHMPSLCAVALAMNAYVDFKQFLLATGEGMDCQGEEYMGTLVASAEYHQRVARLNQLCDLMQRICRHGLLGENKTYSQLALLNLFENLDYHSQGIMRRAGSFDQMMSKCMPDGVTPCTSFTKQDVYDALANAYTHERTGRVFDFTAPRTQNFKFLYPLTLSEFQHKYQEYKDKYRALVGYTTDGRDSTSNDSDDSNQEEDGPAPPRALLTILCEGRGVITERFKLLKSVHACLQPGWGAGGKLNDTNKTAFVFDMRALERAPHPFDKNKLHMNLDNSIALPPAHEIPAGSYVRFVVDVLYHAKEDVWYTVVRSIILCEDQEGAASGEPDLLMGDVVPHPHRKPWAFKYPIVKKKYRATVTTHTLTVGVLN